MNLIKKFSLRLKNSQFQWLQKKSKKTKTSKGGIIRLLIDEIIAEETFIKSIKKKDKRK